MTDQPTHPTRATVPTELHDPTTLRDRPDVDAGSDTTAVDPDAFEAWESLAGVAVLGITGEDGVVLAEGCQGWRLPVAPVDPGEEWTRTATERVEADTGVVPELRGVERVQRNTYRLAESERETTTHTVVFRATAAGGAVEDSEDGETPRAAWFESEPGDLDRRDESAVEDVRRFLG